MNMRKALVALLITTASVPALAVDWMAVDRKITKVFVYEAMTLVEFSPAFSNTQGCSNGGGNTVMIRSSDTGYDQKLSTILAAASGGQDVALSLSGCGGGNFDYPKIYRVVVAY
jgi:hypothetical protein